MLEPKSDLSRERLNNGIHAANICKFLMCDIEQ